VKISLPSLLGDRIIEAFRENYYYSHYWPLVATLFFQWMQTIDLALRWEAVAVVTSPLEGPWSPQRQKAMSLKRAPQKVRKFPINAQPLLEQHQSANIEPVASLSWSRGGFIDWHNFTNRAWKRV